MNNCKYDAIIPNETRFYLIGSIVFLPRITDKAKVKSNMLTLIISSFVSCLFVTEIERTFPMCILFSEN